jgi:chitodextrinase
MRSCIFIAILIVPLGGRSLSAQAPQVPAVYQDLFTSLSTQLQTFDTTLDAGWNGSSYPYLDAPQLDTANSGQYTKLLGANYYAGQVTVQLDELKALGANAVTIHINFPILASLFYQYIGNPSQYQQFVSFYQQVAQDVRARGMKLVVEATLGVAGDGSNMAEYQAYLKTLSWPEYVAGRAADALAVAQLIEPDYMTVLTEPDTEASFSGQTSLNSMPGAIHLVQHTLNTLQQAGVTNVQIGAGVGTWTQNFLVYVQALAALPLNFVDMHVYPVNKTHFTIALQAADIIHAAGKQAGVSECWLWKVRDSELGVIDHAVVDDRNPFSFWGPLDTSFLRSMVHFAKAKQLAFISPYWVHYFFAYLDYNSYGLLPPSTVAQDSFVAANTAMQAGAITPTGHAWENLNSLPDTTPPATPGAPTAPSIGNNNLHLQWQPDTDNVGVSAYNVYRNGSLLTTTSQLTYYDSGLVSGATYRYKMNAADASGNISAMSAPLVVRTIDNTPPSVPANLVVTSLSARAITLSWSPSTAPGGVAGYRVLQGFSPDSMSVHANVTAPPYTDTVRPSTTYYFQVESYNSDEYTSAPGNQVMVTTPAH